MREAFRFVARERRFNWGLLRTANSSSEAKRKNRPTCRSTGVERKRSHGTLCWLQGIAEPNTVVTADATRRLLGSLFELKDLGSYELKGISAPTRA